MVLGPINQVVTPYFSAPNPKNSRARMTPQKRGDQRGISQIQTHIT